MITKTYSSNTLLSCGDQFDFFSSHYSYSETQLSSGFAPFRYHLPLVDSRNRQVIWGFHIVRKAIGEIVCRCIEEGEADSFLEKTEIALSMENRCGSYSLIEKEKIYLFLKNNMCSLPDYDEDWISSVPTSLLSLVQNEGSFIPSTEVFASLPPALKELAGRELLDLKTAKSCSNIPAEALSNLEAVVQKLSFAARRIFLINISEIIKRDSLNDKITCAFAKKLAEEASPTEAAERERRPNLFTAEKEFKDFCDTYLKSTGVRLKHPPFFEGESFGVEFSFKSKKQLDKIIKSLNILQEKSDDIFRLL